MRSILLTLILLFASACSFESAEEDMGGELIAKHQKTNNKISVFPPADGIYTAGDELIFKIKHPFAMTVTGSPTLDLSIGSDDVQASYVSGSGSKTLIFKYTILAGQDDDNGIELNQISLGGGSINFTANDGSESAVDLDLPLSKLKNVIVDNTAPELDSITPPNPISLHLPFTAGTSFEFEVIFDSKVFVTGTPRLQLTVGANTRYATYVSGSGTKKLKFKYTVQSDDYDNNGIQVVSPLQLNNGTIKDIVGLAASDLTFGAVDTSMIIVDGVSPVPVQFIPPAAAVYDKGEKLSMSVKFSKVVTVTGTPRIAMRVGKPDDFNIRYATYASGSGTNTLVFEYTVVVTDYDEDGIEIGKILTLPMPFDDNELMAPNIIDLNGGLIQDGDGNLSLIVINPPLTPSVKVNAILPQVESMEYPAADTYVADDELIFTLKFNTEVIVTGTPRLVLIADTPGQVYATYESGSGTDTLVFKYVADTDTQDLTGIELTPAIDLDGGSIKNSQDTDADLDLSTALSQVTNNPDTVEDEIKLILLDGLSASVTNITLPADATYLASESLNFVLHMTRDVNVVGTPRIALTVGSSTVYANYVGGSGTDTLTFTYIVSNGELDTDGIEMISPLELNGGTMLDNQNNPAVLSYTLPDTSNIRVDAEIPYVTSVDLPENGVYLKDNVLEFKVHFNEAVTVTNSPRLRVTIGSSVRNVSYSSGSGTDTLTFKYAIINGELDLNGITLNNTITLSSGTIRDSASNNANLSLIATNPLGSLAQVKVDSAGPKISQVNLPANGTYSTGEDIEYVIQFDEAVEVTGVPRIAITLNTGTVYANLVSGQGSDSLTFSYTVQSADMDSDGIGTSIAIDLNSSTMRDQYGNQAEVTLGAQDTSLVLVDGITTTSVSLDALAIINDSNKSNYSLSGSCSDNGQPVFINVGSISVSPSPTCIAGSWSATGIDVSAEADHPNLLVTVNHQDEFNNAAPQASSTVLKDTIIPEVTFTSTPDINLSNRNAYSVTGTCSTDDHGRSIQINIGGQNLNTNCNNGNWTLGPINVSAIIDNDTLAITADLTDSAGNQAVQVSATVVKDTIAPTVAITSPTNSSYINQANDSNTFDINGTCDTNGEVVNITIDGVSASSQSGFVCNGTNFSGTIDTTGLSQNAKVFRAELTDSAGNQTVSAAVTVTKDTIAPTISDFTIENDNFVPGNTINATLKFNEDVTISGAAPSVSLDVNSVTRELVGPNSGTSDSFTFSYTLAASEYDYDGMTVSSLLKLNGATISDQAGNLLSNLVFSAPDAKYVRSVASGIQVWLDANDLDTLFTNSGCSIPVSDAGDSVGCWKDLSGKNNHLKQTGTSRPAYATNMSSGKSGITFDGINDYFDVASEIDTKTILIVFKANATALGEPQLYGNYFDGAHIGLNGADGSISINGNASGPENRGTIKVHNGANSGPNTLDSDPGYWSDNTPHFITVVYDANNVVLSRQTVGVRNPSSIGSDQLDGSIMEIIVFSGSLNGAATSAIETYLSSKYGL